MTQRVLFFDLARNVGVAKDSAVPSVPCTYVFRLPGIDGGREEGREYGAAYAALREHISDLITVECPHAIGFEAAINVMGRGVQGQTNVTTIRALFGYCAIVEEVAAARGVPVYEAHLANIRKFATGNGRAQKPEVLATMERFGVDCAANFDRADAAAGWFFLKGLLDKSFTLPILAGARR